MGFKWVGLLAVPALCCCGCQRDGGNRVDDLLSRQEEHAQKISQMSKKVDSVDEKLSNIERNINALLGAASGSASGKGPELTVASSFATTEEYKNIMGEIAALQQQVAVVQGEFAEFQGEERETREREALRDRGAAWRAMSQPQELTRRLDILVKNFSGKIADSTTRSQFVNDVEAMKARYSASLSPQERLAEARRLLSESINSTDSDWARERLERQLQELDEAVGAEEMDERVNRVIQFQRMREIGEMTRKYNIPEETVRDSGLISFGRGGPPGFGPRGGRGR